METANQCEGRKKTSLGKNVNVVKNKNLEDVTVEQFDKAEEFGA